MSSCESRCLRDDRHRRKKSSHLGTCAGLRDKTAPSCPQTACCIALDQYLRFANACLLLKFAINVMPVHAFPALCNCVVKGYDLLRNQFVDLCMTRQTSQQKGVDNQEGTCRCVREGAGRPLQSARDHGIAQHRHRRGDGCDSLVDLAPVQLAPEGTSACACPFAADTSWFLQSCAWASLVPDTDQSVPSRYAEVVNGPRTCLQTSLPEQLRESALQMQLLYVPLPHKHLRRLHAVKTS